MRYILICCIMLCALAPANSQSIEDMSLDLPAGGTISISKAAPGSTVVLLFVSVNCPYSKYYRARIEKLISDYQSKASFILVNSNISEFGQKNPFNVGNDAPYLYDKRQELAKAVDARKSPEAVVLKRQSGTYTVEYSGAIDDSPQMAEDVQENYLIKAIEEISAGRQATVKSTRPTGCMIRLN